MTSLNRARVALSGFVGAPGVATFYFLDVATAVESLHTLWTALVVDMPSGATAQVESTGDIIESTTGVITGAWGGTPQTILNAAGGAAYAPSQGMMIRWTTGTILDGHRLKGRTFVVPMSADAYIAGGTINPVHANPAAAAAVQFVIEQSASLVVWHRPKFGPRPVGGGARPVLRTGGHGLVTGSGVPTKPCSLRSRRD